MSHERYTLPGMAELWSDQYKFDVWTNIEKAVVQAHHEDGLVTDEELAAIVDAQPPSVAAVKEAERHSRHDVIAFLQAFRANIDHPTAGRWVHHGMTSSDLVDTANAAIMSDAGTLVMAILRNLMDTVQHLARVHRETIMVGRTHGVHAEPTTFGHKLSGYAEALGRRRNVLSQSLQQIAVGKLSGAVGTYSNISPDVEFRVLESMGMRAEQHATQVVARDRYAQVVSSLALLSAVIEQIAQEIRLLQRTEVREVMEEFGAKQKGSSAMPHKRNPMTAERLCGLSRVVRGYAQMTMENVALWHERDLTHSSVERIALSGAFSLVHYQVFTLNLLLAGLKVDRQRMRENLDQTDGLIYSSRVLTHLVENGMGSDEAYEAVQKASFRVWEGESTLQEEFPDVPVDLFDPQHFLRHIGH